jgi:hypothetical protein
MRINEFNYDNFHQHKDNIYRVYVWSQAKGGEAAHGITYQPMPLGPAMKTDLPDVENYVRIRPCRICTASSSPGQRLIDYLVTRPL